MSKDGPEWFYAKRYGFGTAFPCSWQGWLVLTIYLGIVIAASWSFAEQRPLVLFAIILPVTAIFVLIVSKTTRGGWKWRWGKDDGTW